MHPSLPSDGRRRSLTARQRQIIELIGRQLSTADIAATLGIAASTVNKHRNHITQKLQLSTTARLTAYCVQTVHPARGAVPHDGRLSLAVREWQILQMLATGMTSKEMARHLALSPRTISEHRHRLMRRLDLHSMAALMALYSRIATVPGH